MDCHLTEEFSNRIAGVRGPAGVQWLHRLPGLLVEIAARWSITVLPPYQPLAYNYVAPAVTLDGRPVVLKAGVPHAEFASEIAALRHFDGEGIVRLLEADPAAGVMLLERIAPGEPLRAMQDDTRTTAIFAAVMRRLRRSLPDNHNFPTVSDWAKGFQRLRNQSGGGTGPFPKSVVDRANGLMSELIGSMSDAVVLHGDLHHGNILSAERDPWLAVDPQGVIGEAEYEVGAWLRNPSPQLLTMTNPKDIMARRVEQLVEELGFDRQRIVGWGYSQAVLSGIWSYEDGSDDWRESIECAEHIAPLLSAGYP